MTGTPEVSVVMSVYNGAANLAATLDSVLAQEDCDFEFIAVNDGSVDTSGQVLDDYAARDKRLRVIHQSNTGLTRALMRGCAQARGTFIARQDADDLSLPGRLNEQASFLRCRPDVVLVASAARFVAPGGEWLFDVSPPATDIAVDIDTADLRLPPLVATCFRRDAYLRAGGFRAVFSVAQDIDLWLRLADQGACEGLDRVHYQATMTLGGISSRRRKEQLRLAALAIECARQRRLGLADTALLDSFVPNPVRRATSRARERAAFHYFIASCLRQQDPVAAKRYYSLALRDNPLHMKALVRRILI
jgi:glycosyltransferase involved in cell wall biosynthesis